MRRSVMGVLVCLVLSIGPGCGQRLRFQVVDATTQQPLPGVGVRQHTEVVGLSVKFRTRELPMTDANGLVASERLDVKRYFGLRFTKPGYQSSWAGQPHGSGPEGARRGMIRIAAPELPPTTESRGWVLIADPIRVPLYPTTQPVLP